MQEIRNREQNAQEGSQLKTARELSYVPNRMASALNRGGTSTHRVHYCTLHADFREAGLAHLDELLGRLGQEHPDVTYLTSWEAAQLCRFGTSAARFADRWVLRNYTEEPQRVATGSDLTQPAVNLRTGSSVDPVSEEAGTYVLPPGDYLAGR